MKRFYFLHWLVLGLTFIVSVCFIIFIMHKIVQVRIVIKDDIEVTEIIDVKTETERITETELVIDNEETSILIIKPRNHHIPYIQSETELTDIIETESEIIDITPVSLIDIYEKYDLESDAIVLAKLMWTEAGGINSTIERACVAWTVLNRVDKYGTSVYTEVTKPYQFAWKVNAPVYADLLELAYDVLARWYLEKETGEIQGRVLPQDYIYFYGDGKHNYFFTMWENKINAWDYSLPSPYTD